MFERQGRLDHLCSAGSQVRFVVVQAGFRTRHVTTVAFTVVRRNATL